MLLISLMFSQIGTCAMKPREQSGVVDARLNVYGVQNLKIAGNFPITHSFGYYISDPFCFRLQYRTRQRRS